MINNLTPVIQNIKNLAAEDRRGVQHNLQIIEDLLKRVSDLRDTNVFLEKRARQYDKAVSTLEGLKDE